MDTRIDRNMEDAVKGINELNELSDAEKQQCWNGLCDLQMRTVGVRGKIQIAVDSFRAAADELDRVWRDCKIAHAAGTTGGIISSCLALASATVVTGGAAMPILLAGLGFGFGGAATNIGTICVEASINSSVIEKAGKLWGEAIESINDLTTIVHGWLDKKEKARIAYILCVAEALDPILQKLLRDIASTAFEISINILKSLSSATAQIADDAAQAGKTGMQVADDTAQVGKAGLQASDDLAQEGAKAGSNSAGKYAGKVLIAANIAFLMVDCIDLGFTVRDLVKNKGSEAAKDLRKKAKQLEDLLEEL